MFFIIYFAILGVLSFGAYSVATEKGREGALWAFVTFIFPIAVIVLLCLSDNASVRTEPVKRATAPVAPVSMHQTRRRRSQMSAYRSVDAELESALKDAFK